MVKIGKNVRLVKVVPSMTTLSFFEAKLALRRFREGRRWSPWGSGWKNSDHHPEAVVLP
jgi:hypothetical protein